MSSTAFYMFNTEQLKRKNLEIFVPTAHRL